MGQGTLYQRKTFKADQLHPLRRCEPDILRRGRPAAGIEELSKGVEELVLWTKQSATVDTNKCSDLTLSRMIEAFPLART
jgi:hypothetical protein